MIKKLVIEYLEQTYTTNGRIDRILLKQSDDRVYALELKEDLMNCFDLSEVDSLVLIDAFLLERNPNFNTVMFWSIKRLEFNFDIVELDIEVNEMQQRELERRENMRQRMHHMSAISMERMEFRPILNLPHP